MGGCESMKKQWIKPTLQMLLIEETSLNNNAQPIGDCFDGSDRMPPGQVQFCPVER